jgi:Ca2+-dependent lipid-binding protein
MEAKDVIPKASGDGTRALQARVTFTKQKVRTPVVKHTLEPHWDTLCFFEIPLAKGEQAEQQQQQAQAQAAAVAVSEESGSGASAAVHPIAFKVVDTSGTMRDEILGTVSVDVATIPQERVVERTLEFTKATKKSGSSSSSAS